MCNSTTHDGHARNDPGGHQSEVIRLLSDPASYEPPVETVERIETHGALIFLAGDYAYKLKRAVKLPYLDFSTLEKRAEVCRREIERNKTAAQDIYIAAKPIVRLPSGELAIAEDGETVDWVVVMRRFDQADLLDNLAREGRLSLDLMPPLADEIAAYHDNAPTYPALSGYDILANVVTQTIMAFSEASDLLDLARARTYATQISQALNAQAQLLRTRGRKAQIKLCHGDLHLRNIVLLNGKPTLFDAIEFDDGIAKIDVLYDLAFLLMDLWHRDLKAHANLCFNTYASQAITTDGLRGLAILPVFLATRAAIRAMVAVDRARCCDASQQDEVNQEIDDYFSLAGRFLNTSEPQLIAVGGLSGTGKTTLAAALASGIGPAPGALHLRSDVERKRMLGKDPLEKLPRQAYSARASERVYNRLCERAEQSLKAGHSVIVDATFLEPGQRRQIERIATRTHSRFFGFWLEASEDLLIERVINRRNDASDADASVVQAQIESHTRCNCWETIDARVERKALVSRAHFALKSIPYRQT